MLGERTKNHQTGSENLNNVIPFLPQDQKINPGRLMELYLQFTHPENNRLFQRARTVSKKFDLHDLDQTQLFENAAVGKGTVGKNLRALCELLGKDELTNHCLRTTGINILKRSGYDDREIMAVSGRISTHVEISFQASTFIEIE